MNVQVLFLFFMWIEMINTKDTDSDEAKYIDLLPEEEKQDFLNKIAQRILAEIQSGNRSDRTSVEISDERLDEHDAYVQKIMEEETENFKHKRRLGSQSKADNVENDEASEMIEKSLEKEDLLGQDKSNNIDIMALKNNVRIKKDTNEDNNQTSIESRRVNSDDLVREIAVPVLYDDSLVTAKNGFTEEEVVKEHIMENNLEVEGLNKRSGKQDQNSQTIYNQNEAIGLQFQNEDNSKEMTNGHILEDTRNSYADYVDTRTEATSDSLRTVNNDFEPEGIIFEKTNNINKTKQDQFINIESQNLALDTTRRTSDLSNGRLFEFNVESSTNGIISATSKVTEEDVTPRTTDNTLKVISNEYTSHASRPILRSKVESSELDVKNYSMQLNNEEFKGSLLETGDIGMNMSVEDKKHNHEIVLTTSNIGQENYTSSDVDNSITTQNVLKMLENRNQNRSYIKQALRHGSGDMVDIDHTVTEKYTSKDQNFLPPSADNDNSHYRVFEVSNKNSPFVPSEQVNSEFLEEPRYVPVYNYDPTNAFYTGYNYFGPNYEENDKDKQINTNDDKFYTKSNIQNSIQGYINGEATKQNTNVFNNKHRSFTFYDNNQGNYKPRSKAHQKYLSPASKGGFFDISFNPNDYLDMDYYLGRINDVPDSMYDDFIHREPQSLFPPQLRQDKSEDVVDPDASEERYNIKDNIAALRNALYVHKYSKMPKVIDKYNMKNKLKTKLTKWKQSFDPILRGLDDTFLILLSGGKSGGGGADDDKNIAVDYYFSRMNSEELPLVDSNEAYVKPITDKTTTKANLLKNTRTLKKVKEKKEKVRKKEHIQIPLNPNNVLKIDLAVKNGDNVNIIFRNVKKPELKKFDTYLKSYINVMRDMIEHDSKGLVLYDWPASTVDIQSAIQKLLGLTQALQAQEKLHYSDFELIKYILYSYQTCNRRQKEGTERRSEYNQKNKRNNEKGKRKGKGTTPSFVRDKMDGSFEQPLKILHKIYDDIKEIQHMSVTVSGSVLVEFENFLLDLQISLNKLHEAIKEIATITEFKKQNWFHDLKDLYLTPADRDVVLTLLLHLATSKLFGIIEDGAKNGLEDNFIIFVQNHRAQVERTREEFVFVLRLLYEIKKVKS